MVKREVRDKAGYKNRDLVSENYVWKIRFFSEAHGKIVKCFVCFY